MDDMLLSTVFFHGELIDSELVSGHEGCVFPGTIDLNGKIAGF